MEFPKEHERNDADIGSAEQIPSDAEKPARPVRMKWGKPVYDPADELPSHAPEGKEPLTIPTESTSEEISVPTVTVQTESEPKTRSPIENKPPKPRTDARVEALQRHLARIEREQAQLAAQKAEEERLRKAEEAKQKATEEQQAPVLSPKKNTPSPTGKRPPEKTPLERERERREAEARRAETERMREELERDALRKAIRKKRRKEAISDGFHAFFIGIFRFLRALIPSKKTVIALSVTLPCAILLAVILGNLLKDRVDGDLAFSESSAPTETDAETVPYDRGMMVPQISAGIVSLEGATTQKLRAEAKRFSDAGMSAVSLLLRNEQGELLFSSNVNASLGANAETGHLTISEILTPFSERGLYVSCLLPIRFFIDGDADSSRVLYAYETALLAEIAKAGADEVVLLGADRCFLETDENGMPKHSAEHACEVLSEIAYVIHADAPSAAVGLACAPEFLATVESDLQLSALARAFDFTLLDLREIFADGNEDDRLLSETVSAHLYFILRYGMRVLIPAGNATALAELELYNWQEGTLPLENDLSGS